MLVMVDFDKMSLIIIGLAIDLVIVFTDLTIIGLINPQGNSFH